MSLDSPASDAATPQGTDVAVTLPSAATPPAPVLDHRPVTEQPPHSHPLAPPDPLALVPTITSAPNPGPDTDSATNPGQTTAVEAPVDTVELPSVELDGGVADPSVVQRVGANYGTVIGTQIVQEIRRLRGSTLSKEWVSERLSTFVRDEGAHKRITDTLTVHRAVVLHAGPGTGRYTTALDVLRHQVGDSIRQVRREPGEYFDIEALPDQNTGWILDLRADDENLSRDFGVDLAAGAPFLEATGSFLIVLTHSQAWSKSSQGAGHLGHALMPAKAEEVLRVHLERGRPPVRADRWLSRDTIANAISGRTPGQVVDTWVRAIREAEQLDHRDASESDASQGFAELVDHVVHAAEDWRTQLRQWHTAHPVSDHRNYLLAAAVLDGAPVEIVYEAADTLSCALKETPQPALGQQGPGVIELTHVIGAELDGDDVIRFARPGYAEATVDYFWVDRPHLVADFTRWTADQAAILPPELAEPLASRVSQWAVRYTARKNTVKLLRTIATQWAQPKALPQHAQELLIAAALDPETGRLARDKYLAWARQDDTAAPAHFKAVLALACGQLGAVYPTVMLLRLSELAAHTADLNVTHAVGDALNTLWEQPRLRPEIRQNITAWADSLQDARRTAARRAFTHLAARIEPDGLPSLLVESDPAHAAWNLAGWRTVLDEPIHSRDVQEAFSLWMDTALALPRNRQTIVDTFVNAVYRSDSDPTYLAPRYLALSHALYVWTPPTPGQNPTERTQLRDRLLTAIRSADPAAPSPGDYDTTP